MIKVIKRLFSRKQKSGVGYEFLSVNPITGEWSKKKIKTKYQVVQCERANTKRRR